LDKEKAMYRSRVLIAEDHALLREAFQELLSCQHEVVGAVSNGRELLDVCPKLKPDIVVVDIAMPVLNGFDAALQLKKIMPYVKLIFLTINEDPDVAREAIRIGGSGYLFKSSAASELFLAIREALCGRTYVTRLLTQGREQLFVRLSSGRKTMERLTMRQREVLQLLAEGYSMKEIGCVLGIKPRTIAFHKYRLMEEFQLKNNVDLLQFAMKQRLVFQQPRYH
jgi:DNA-binding NarL/FixJ family response regulator